MGGWGLLQQNSLIWRPLSVSSVGRLHGDAQWEHAISLWYFLVGESCYSHSSSIWHLKASGYSRSQDKISHAKTEI